ncbi:MAG: tetratricopeptide repeat-containing sulfotransferase family protein [Alphaproteobacteria bacterium]
MTKPDTAPTEEQINGLIALYTQGRLGEALGQGAALAARYPEVALIRNILGAVNAAAGRLDEAVASYTEALRIEPDYVEAHYNLGVALNDLGKHEEAVASYTEAVRIKPDYAATHNNLGNALKALGRHEEAIASYTEALRIEPDNAEAQNNLGVALNDLGKHEEAIASYRKALRLKPDIAEVHGNLGTALGDFGKHEEAVASYTKALQITPGDARAHYHLGVALKTLGRHEEAIARLTEALRLKPDYAEAQRILGTLGNYQTDDPQIARMLALIANPSISENDKMHLGFALGKALDDIGDVEGAFRHLLEGNRLRKKELGYDIGPDKRLFSLIRSIFAADELAALEEIQPAAGRSKQPIFIVGMPRSGTTLVEQILASHSQVYGADELDILNKNAISSVNKISKNELRKLTNEELVSVWNGYFDALNKIGGDEPNITDKMPLNFRWIGFILTAMPETKIINLQRDPVATCWSAFRNYFSSKGTGYTCDLFDIAEYYKMYVNLIDFWQARFPNKIYDLNYESLTENQEQETRKLLEYCDLGWEDQCLESHMTDRAVRTASSFQVRQEIYKGSSEAWRKYEALLQPMLQALEG